MPKIQSFTQELQFHAAYIILLTVAKLQVD